MGDGAADGTGEGESRVQVKALGSVRVGGGGRGLDGIKLDGAGGGGGGLSRHCDDGREMDEARGSGELLGMKDSRRCRSEVDRKLEKVADFASLFRCCR